MQSIKAASVYDRISNNQMAIMLRKKEKPITTIVCKLSILKALSDTESTFCLSLVIVFSPFITLYYLYVLKIYLFCLILNNCLVYY